MSARQSCPEVNHRQFLPEHLLRFPQLGSERHDSAYFLLFSSIKVIGDRKALELFLDDGNCRWNNYSFISGIRVHKYAQCFIAIMKCLEVKDVRRAIVVNQNNFIVGERTTFCPTTIRTNQSKYCQFIDARKSIFERLGTNKVSAWL